MSIQVEICCGGYYDALQAYQGGARRIELNSALHLGGLTPSVAMLRLTKQHTDLNVMTMIRPRGAGFHYNKEDFDVMLMDAQSMLDNGADGIVIGCLDEEGNIDIEQNKQLIKLAKDMGKEVVFHRAIDCVKDIYAGVEVLISLGIDRILTSGSYPNVTEGKDVLKQLQERYGDQIEILAGCGLNATNAQDIIDYTKVKQVHSSCKNWLVDKTTCKERVHYSYGPTGHESDYEIVDANLVKKLINSIK